MILNQRKTAFILAILMISCTMAVLMTFSVGNADASVPGIPGAPSGVAATSGSSFVKITWLAPSDNISVTSYLVYRSIGFSAQTQVGNAPGLFYNDTTVTNGVTYNYWVRAVDEQNQSFLSSMISVTPGTVPSVPSSFSGSFGDKQVTLSWNVPNNNGGFQISAYKLYRSTETGSFALIANNSQTDYTDSGLVNGMHYQYKVSAVNQLGEGPKSNGVVLVPMTTPSVPGGLRSYFGDAQATLTWVQPLVNGGGNVTSYNIYQRVSGTSWTFVANTSQTGYMIGDLVNGYHYEFTVAGVNAAGEGTRSMPVTSGTSDVPSMVTNLQAYPGLNNVTLTWKIPGYDGGSSVLQYAVYRSSSADGRYALVGMTGHTYFTDQTASAGTTYNYRVGSGNAVGFGEMSGQVSVDPLSAPVPWLAYLLIIAIPIVVAIALIINGRKKQ